MSNWYQLDLGDGGTAEKPADQLRKTFLRMHASDDEQQDMALFIRHDSSHSVHCHVPAGWGRLLLIFGFRLGLRK